MELTQLVLEGQKILKAVDRSEVKAIPVGNPFVIRHAQEGVLRGEIGDLATKKEIEGYVVGTSLHWGTTKYTPVQLYKILR